MGDFAGWSLPRAGQEPGWPAGTAPSRTYWRRRFFVLLAGLVVLSAAAFGLSDALRVSQGAWHPGAGRQGTSGKGTTGKGTGKHARAGHRGGALGAGAWAPGTARAGNGAPQARASARPGARSSASGGTASRARAQRPIRPAFCARRDIVLSVFASSGSFGAGQRVSFGLDVVSTQRAECSFNLGSRHLALEISEGTERIWSSADCASGTGSLITALRRGVPTVLEMTWNRRTSSPGCSGPAQPVPPGVYSVRATEGPVASAPVTITLR